MEMLFEQIDDSLDIVAFLLAAFKTISILSCTNSASLVTSPLATAFILIFLAKSASSLNILVKCSIIIDHKMTFLSVQSLHLAHPSQLGSVLQYSHFSHRSFRNPPSSSSALVTITMTANTAPKRTRYLFIMVCNQISS